jgi:hypothetical protein
VGGSTLLPGSLCPTRPRGIPALDTFCYELKMSRADADIQSLKAICRGWFSHFYAHWWQVAISVVLALIVAAMSGHQNPWTPL